MRAGEVASRVELGVHNDVGEKLGGCLLLCDARDLRVPEAVVCEAWRVRFSARAVTDILGALCVSRSADRVRIREDEVVLSEFSVEKVLAVVDNYVLTCLYTVTLK